MIRRSPLAIAESDARLTPRCSELMERYRDHPMNLADATLMALAEERDRRTMFTLDEHFRSYRLRAGRY